MPRQRHRPGGRHEAIEGRVSGHGEGYRQAGRAEAGGGSREGAIQALGPDQGQAYENQESTNALIAYIAALVAAMCEIVTFC